MRLSQRHLNILSSCPRKFQHTYLDQFGSVTTPEQQEKLSWGSHFHLLMQQRELGLPIESLLQEDSKMQHSVVALISAAPEILTPNPTSENFRDSEHFRSFNFHGYLLTVAYDLLIASEKKAQILDWKTYPEPKKRHFLEQDWQTRLYMFVLAETSDYKPEEISMTYWFVQSQPEPKSLKFAYNTEKHEQTKEDLIGLFNQLNYWLERYKMGEEFPQIAESSRDCNFCQFAVRCERSLENQEAAINREKILALANIEEVPLEFVSVEK